MSTMGHLYVDVRSSTVKSSTCLLWRHLHVYYGVIYMSTMGSSICQLWFIYSEVIYMSTFIGYICPLWGHLHFNIRSVIYCEVIYRSTMESSICQLWGLTFIMNCHLVLSLWNDLLSIPLTLIITCHLSLSPATLWRPLSHSLIKACIHGGA